MYDLVNIYIKSLPSNFEITAHKYFLILFNCKDFFLIEPLFLKPRSK